MLQEEEEKKLEGINCHLHCDPYKSFNTPAAAVCSGLFPLGETPAVC